MRSHVAHVTTTTPTPAVLPALLLFLVGSTVAMRDQLLPAAPDPDTCRTVHSREILVCDPEEIFTRDQILNLETRILRIRNETVSQCNTTAADARGFTLRLALVKRYNQSLLPFSQPNFHFKYADKMHAYADYLHSQWAAERGDCDDSVLIFISKENKAVITVVGKEVDRMLPPNFRANLCKQMVARMSRGGNVMSAVRFGLNAVGDALRHGPSHGLESSAQHRRATLTIVGVMVATTVTLVAITCVVLRWRKRRRRHKDTNDPDSMASVGYDSTDDDDEDDGGGGEAAEEHANDGNGVAIRDLSCEFNAERLDKKSN